VQARERRFVEARRGEPLAPRGVGLLRSEAANVERRRAQRDDQRRIVELRIVGQSDDRTARVERERFERDIGPLGHEREPGKARRGRPRAPRVDDRHHEPGEARHLGERLRDMDRTDDDESRRRIVRLDEDAVPLRLGGAVASRSEIVPRMRLGGAVASRSEVVPRMRLGGAVASRSEVVPRMRLDDDVASRSEVVPRMRRDGAGASRSEIVPRVRLDGAVASRSEIVPRVRLDGAVASRSEIVPRRRRRDDIDLDINDEGLIAAERVGDRGRERPGLRRRDDTRVGAIEPCHECDRTICGTRRAQGAEHLWVDQLDEDLDPATAGEPDLPGSGIGDAVREHAGGAAPRDQLERLGDHGALDAATGDRADELAAIVDRERNPGTLGVPRGGLGEDRVEIVGRLRHSVPG